MDVTAYITGNGVYNLAFSTTSSTNISFASREAGANAPQLVIQTQSGPISTPTATPTAGPSVTPTNTSVATATITPTLAPTVTPAAPPPFSNATFVYDGDGNRVKSTINGTMTTFVGAHYEETSSMVIK